MKTLVHGDKTLMGKFKIARGAEIPTHSHPHKQTGLLLCGKLRFKVEEEEVTTEPGDSWCIRGGVEHSAEALEDSVMVEVFSPVRDDYLPKVFTYVKNSWTVFPLIFVFNQFLRDVFFLARSQYHRGKRYVNGSITTSPNPRPTNMYTGRIDLG